MNLPFISLSKNLVFSGDLPSKALMILAYLRINCNMIGELLTCIQWITTGIGFQPKSGAGNSLDQTKSLLIMLRETGAIDFEDPRKSTDQIRIRLSLDHQYFDPPDGFVQIDYDELQKITSCSYQRKDRLFAVYYVMKSYIYIDPRNGESGYCYPALKRILGQVMSFAEMSHNTLVTILDVLVENELLNVYHVGRYIDDRLDPPEIRTFPSIYCLGEKEINESECIQIAKDNLLSRGIEVGRFFPITKPEEDPVLWTL